MQNFLSMLQSWRFWKSILSSSITAIADLSLLFFLREVLHWSSFAAVNASFLVAILVNFSLQKFWTFSDRNLRLTHRQFAKFFMVSMINLVMNGFIMFFLMTTLSLWYLGAQIITMGLLAVMNFTLYRHFVFK